MTTPDPTRSKAIEVMRDAMFGSVEWSNFWAKEEAYILCEAALTAYESHLKAEGMAVVPVAHLEPFAKYYRSRMAVQMRGMDDCIHAIHRGTEYEAEISVTDCGRLNAAMVSASPSMKAGKEEPTPSPSATELALAEAVGHIALLTAFWMETPGWTRAAEAAREFIGGVPIDWKAPAPPASAERSGANQAGKEESK